MNAWPNIKPGSMGTLSWRLPDETQPTPSFLLPAVVPIWPMSREDIARHNKRQMDYLRENPGALTLIYL